MKSLNWAVPKELGIPPDPLRLRIDFHHQATTLTFFDDETVETRIVDAMDIAHALANELTFSTGILPPGTIWWNNTKAGPIYAIYCDPQVRKLALQTDIDKRPKRYKVPMPGLVFLCNTGKPPWVFAVKKKPTKETDIVYEAPLANVFTNGRTCPGSHQYPNRVADIIGSFFVSFFSATAALGGRSKKFPKNIIEMWEFLDKSKEEVYPLDDLVKHCTVRDLMNLG